jgi:PAS domain S-box-containing protein
MPIDKPPRTHPGQASAEHDVQNIEAHRGLFVEAVEATRMPMAITDPGVIDNPIIYVNAAFLEMCGYERDEVLGQNYFFLIGEHADPDVARRIEAAMGARRQISEDLQFQVKDGREIWVSMFVSPIIKDDRVVQHFVSFLDITDRVAREEEQRRATETLDRRLATRTRRLKQVNARLEEIERRRRTEALLRDAIERGQEDLRFRDYLIREVNHRTKNALQMAGSLLSLQSRHSADATCRDLLEASMRRLQRISAVHDLLTYRNDAPNTVDFADYLHRLCREMAESLVLLPGQVRIEVDAEEEAIWGPDLVVPLGLIVGEAITNALKHAFPEGRAGRVRVELLAQSLELMILRIEDDGVGMPSNRREGSLGLKLIEMFARQINGKARMEGKPGGEGTIVVVTFPVLNTSAR